MKKTFFSILLLLLAGIQTAQAQAVLLNLSDNRTITLGVDELDSIVFSPTLSYAGGYEYVDLDLPSGTLWATCNVGASSPEDFGGHFAWGETETKSSYDWNSYKWMNEGQSSYTQLNRYTFPDGQTEGCWYDSKIFFGDGLTQFLPVHDAAAVRMGCMWQTPTAEQFQELINSAYTTTEWTQMNGVNGRKVTSLSNGKSIFLPAAGEYYGTYLDESLGAYWSRSLSPDLCNRASYLSFNSERIFVTNFNRSLGHSIRPVRAREYEYVDLELPSGTLWATCNIGANNPWEFGAYFAWGEIEPKYEDDYDWSAYKWCEGTERSITKYCTNGGSCTDDAYPDGKVELEPMDDAATANWGSDWQMPNLAQCLELLNPNYTTEMWTQQNEVYGIRITSKRNGKSIFLPAAGDPPNGWLDRGIIFGSYWSRNLDTHASESAYMLNISFESIRIDKWYRCNGYSVRPVRKK